MTELTRLGDSPKFQRLKNEIMSLAQDVERPRPDPVPQVPDWTNTTPDEWFELGLIRAGYDRYIKANDPYCYCAEGYEFVRDGIHPNAISCTNCGRLRRSLNKLVRAQLPNEALKVTLDEYEFDSDEQYDAYDRFIMWQGEAANPPSMFMHGKPGNGKSTILYLIAKQMCARGFNVKYAHHYTTFQAEKKSWNNKSGFTHLDRWLNGVDVLLFDELGGLGGGTKSHTDWFKTTTIEMIGAIYQRWKAGKMSVAMTTNMAPSEILRNLFDGNRAALSRLQSIFGEPIEMEGPDRRNTYISEGWLK
jgi:DNA replication protein DnaC